MILEPQNMFYTWSGVFWALKVALYDFFDGPLAPLNGQFLEKVNHYNTVGGPKSFWNTPTKT